MTLTQQIEAVGAFAKAAWWWLLVIGLVIGVLFMARACNRTSRAEDEVARLREAAELQAKGHAVAERITEAALTVALDKAPAALRAEVDRLTKDLGEKPKIVTVERIVTAPTPGEGVPRPDPIPGAPCPDCLFAAGDTGQIRIDEAHLQTDAGNEVVALSAECWRLTPTESVILSGTASAPLSRVAVVTPPARAGWGAGLAGGIATTGPIGSALLVSPLFFDQHLEAAGIISAGQGIFGAQVALIWRP